MIHRSPVPTYQVPKAKGLALGLISHLPRHVETPTRYSVELYIGFTQIKVISTGFMYRVVHYSSDIPRTARLTWLHRINPTQSVKALDLAQLLKA